MPTGTEQYYALLDAQNRATLKAAGVEVPERIQHTHTLEDIEAMAAQSRRDQREAEKERRQRLGLIDTNSVLHGIAVREVTNMVERERRFPTLESQQPAPTVPKRPPISREAQEKAWAIYRDERDDPNCDDATALDRAMETVSVRRVTPLEPRQVAVQGFGPMRDGIFECMKRKGA